MQKQEKKFSADHRSSFWIKLIWDRTPPQLYIECSVYVWGRAQGSQIFKQNSIIWIRSKVIAFLVILLSPRGPRCPRVVHIVPVIPTSSPHCSHHPHIIPIAPRRSHVVSMVCGLHMLSLLSSRHPPVILVIPVVLTSSP